MKTKWIASLVLASALATPAFAGVGVYARSRVCVGRRLLELVRRKVCVEARSVAEAPLCWSVLEPSPL
jgi:hypothetical protein